MNVSVKSFAAPSLFRALALLWLVSAMLSPAQARDNGLDVSIPNGYANVNVEDLGLQSTAGRVRWLRAWDGQEWKFNPHWESLSQSWRNLTGSWSADGTGNTAFQGGGPVSAPSSSACWVSVDDGWQPASAGAALLPERSTPFNRALGTAAADYPPPAMVSVDYASLCPGAANSAANREGFRRQNELYLGTNGQYAYNNRDTLAKQPVRALPAQDPATLAAQLATGSISLNPVANPKGFRWRDRAGEWIDYNTQGQAVAYGDKNKQHRLAGPRHRRLAARRGGRQRPGAADPALHRQPAHRSPRLPRRRQCLGPAATQRQIPVRQQQPPGPSD